MNIEAAFKFVIFLITFGLANYLIMVYRYENDLNKIKIIRKNKISKLYPKDTFINV